MRFLVAIILALGLIAGTGCTMYRAPFQPAHGLLVSSVKAPLSVDFDRTEVAGNTGTASSMFVSIPFTDNLLSFAWNDCDIASAARNGGLDQVEYADYEFLQILGLFGRMTVVAHGKPATAQP